MWRKVGWQLTSFGDNQATVVSNDTSFEEMRWTLMQTPQDQWNAVSAKKLAEANEKFQKFTQVQAAQASSCSSTGQSGGATTTSASVTSPFGPGATGPTGPTGPTGASASPFGGGTLSPFAAQATSPVTSSPFAPFAATGQAQSTSPFSQAASPFAQASSYTGTPVAGLEPINLRQHEEREIDQEVLRAFQSAAFEWLRIPEVEPPPSVC